MCMLNAVKWDCYSAVSEHDEFPRRAFHRTLSRSRCGWRKLTGGAVADEVKVEFLRNLRQSGVRLLRFFNKFTNSFLLKLTFREILFVTSDISRRLAQSLIRRKFEHITAHVQCALRFIAPHRSALSCRRPRTNEINHIISSFKVNKNIPVQSATSIDSRELCLCERAGNDPPTVAGHGRVDWDEDFQRGNVR